MSAQDLFATRAFWPEFNAGQIVLFVCVLVGAAGIVFLVKWWMDRRQSIREASQFLEHCRRAQFSPEEYETAVDLVNQHDVSPAIRLLVSLRHFDAVATAEIQATLQQTGLETPESRQHVQRLYTMRHKLARTLAPDVLGETQSDSSALTHA